MTRSNEQRKKKKMIKAGNGVERGKISTIVDVKKFTNDRFNVHMTKMKRL